MNKSPMGAMPATALNPAIHPLTELVRDVLRGGPADLAVLPARQIKAVADLAGKHRDGVAVVLYQPGLKRIVIVRTRGDTPLENLVEAVRGLAAHPRFKHFDLAKSARMQIDFLTILRRKVPFSTLTFGKVDKNRFELGVDGLRVAVDGALQYLLPGDAYVRSLHEISQLRSYMRSMTKTQDIDGLRVDILRSNSVVSFGEGWIPLYRGHPRLERLTLQDVELICDRAVEHVLDYMRDDGRFLYYYDAALDTERDHDHPKRDPVKNPYYNILRHAGGIVTLLLDHERRPDPKIRQASEKALDYLVDQSVQYWNFRRQPCRFIYSSKKAKLGGSGLALLAICRHIEMFGGEKYLAVAEELKNHILEEIMPGGEFRYYTLYLDRIVPYDEVKEYFSFYYPGEAIMGLAAFLRNVRCSSEDRKEMAGKIHEALEFLLVRRPSLRASEYKSLPSDAWLMSGILELWDMPEFRRPLYRDFVYSDADKMVGHMYGRSDALYPDYVGAFYYEYGDQPYPDGARCEGLVSALALAMREGDPDRMRRYASALVLTTRAISALANTPESLYFADNPWKALGGIRFKLTRQWFRIDTIQHVVCYYLRFVKLYRELMASGTELDERFD